MGAFVDSTSNCEHVFKMARKGVFSKPKSKPVKKRTKSSSKGMSKAKNAPKPNKAMKQLFSRASSSSNLIRAKNSKGYTAKNFRKTVAKSTSSKVGKPRSIGMMQKPSGSRRQRNYPANNPKQNEHMSFIFLDANTINPIAEENSNSSKI